MVKGLLALSLLLGCLAVGCSGDRHHRSDEHRAPKTDHIDKGQRRKPVEVYLKLSANPQLFVAKKSEEGFLFTTARPGAPDRKQCEQCVFRIVCKGPDCAEVCELCGKDSGAKFTDHDSDPCSESQEMEPVSRDSRRRKGQTTTASQSTTRQPETVTSSNKPGRFSEQDGSKMTKSDERVGPVRKWIKARREFRRKQLEERNKARSEARKLNGARETEPKDEKSTTSVTTKTTKQSEEKDEKMRGTTKAPISPKDGKESTESLEHSKDKSDKTHENEVVFHIPKKKEPTAHDHSEQSAKPENRVKVSEEDLSENSKILKLLEKIIKQKEMDKMEEERKHRQETEQRKAKVETTTKRLDGKATKPSKASDATHSHAIKVVDEKEKSAHSAEPDWDSAMEENFVQSGKKEEPDGWPQLIAKLVQTEIESAHLLIKHKPLKAALKNLKQRFKPIFIAASKALANVFGVQTVEEETIKAKKDKDEKEKSSPATLAPPPTAVTSKPSPADDTHLSKPTAVKMDTHRRRASIYSARSRRPKDRRRRRPLSLRASVKNKLRELESADKSGSAGHGKDCSCKCLASR
ncbi:nucleolar protein dao-5-like [Anopheles stephensi]|uniref:nucleolar protein dao-5-like n=1 Tax=Anopheles stephensi TaxID=30069 RepID=UPI001658BF16|nr:nucleolar protein dao-5-like [Anopheles stephensi]